MMTRRRRRGREDGQAIVQFAAGFPVAVLAILICFKLFVVITTIERVNNAARDGARAASLAHDKSKCRPAALATLPKWLTHMENNADHLPDPHPFKPPHSRVAVYGGDVINGDVINGVSCQVIVKVPLLWSSLDWNYNVDRTVRMPG